MDEPREEMSLEQEFREAEMDIAVEEVRRDRDRSTAELLSEFLAFDEEAAGLEAQSFAAIRLVRDATRDAHLDLWSELGHGA